MILIIGGAFSGRHDFAKSLLENFTNSIVYDISKNDAQSFSEEIESSLKDKDFNVQIALSRVVEKISSFPIVIATEMGCGIVPLSEDDRKFRESNGKLNQALAKIAQKVVFMTCGIPNFIKGEKFSSIKFDISSYALIFRHGQTQSNVEKRFAGGLSDVPLTEKGIEEAKTTKSKMNEFFENYQSDIKKQILNPKRIFVSPMIRTQNTAKILFPNAKIVTIDDLCEMKMGLFENMTHSELSSGKFADGSISKENAELYQRWIDSNGEMQCPTSDNLLGDSVSMFVQRVQSAFEKIRSTLDENELPIIVAHGGIQKALCEVFFNKTCGKRIDYWQSENAMFRFGELK